MQVCQANNVKVYNLSLGKSLPEVSSLPNQFPLYRETTVTAHEMQKVPYFRQCSTLKCTPDVKAEEPPIIK